MSIKEAFFTVCNEAQPAEGAYVSLYIRTPYYGGPEEGGWWGSDTDIVAYHHYPTIEQAEQAQDRVIALAAELNENAKREFGDQCLREMEWLEARGLDADYLPEVDGEVSYFVEIEAEVGIHRRRGCRHYE